MTSRPASSALAAVVVLCMLIDNSCVHAAPALRKVNMREVETDLQNALSALLGGASSSATRRLGTIEASTWQTFQALPKNAAGRLAPTAVRYIVHGYFAKEHGWLIKGLEPHVMHSNTEQVHDVSVLQDKVPFLVEHLLEVRQADRGLAHNDVVAMIAVLEQLMFDESITLLEAAYHLNGLAIDDELDEPALHRVMMSYLVLFDQGAKADLTDVERHQAKLLARKRTGVDAFENDVVLNYLYARWHSVNPFSPRGFSFQVASEIMEIMAQGYGKFQNAECRDMKSHLIELDPERTGRVPLGLFYAQPQSSSYHFSESSDYLRQIGALDETSSTPQVILANYVAGPSNCIASSAYYSVCCLSECDGIFNELERHVLAPKASPEKILSTMRNISDVDLSRSLPMKLRSIAAQHDGEVPLHGRLFAQWLHFAFPHECPYPSVLESATTLTASQWLGGQSAASKEERDQHLQAPLAFADTASSSIDARWSEHEVLPLHETSSSSFISGAGVVRSLVQLAAILVALRSTRAAWRGIASAFNGSGKKNDDYVLPFRV